MIVGQQKPFEEIWQRVKEHRQLTVFGCNTCVAVCHQGGNKEAGILASQLRMRAVQDGLEIKIDDSGIERQCEHEFFEKTEELIQGSEAVLSLACGIGVQFMAGKYPKIPIYPALNTTFLGDVPETGLFSEKCQACGDCVLGGDRRRLPGQPLRQTVVQRSLRRFDPRHVRDLQRYRVRLATGNRPLGGTRAARRLREGAPHQRLVERSGRRPPDL